MRKIPDCINAIDPIPFGVATSRLQPVGCISPQYIDSDNYYQQPRDVRTAA